MIHHEGHEEHEEHKENIILRGPRQRERLLDQAGWRMLVRIILGVKESQPVPAAIPLQPTEI